MRLRAFACTPEVRGTCAPSLRGTCAQGDNYGRWRRVTPHSRRVGHSGRLVHNQAGGVNRHGLASESRRSPHPPASPECNVARHAQGEHTREQGSLCPQVPHTGHKNALRVPTAQGATSSDPRVSRFSRSRGPGGESALVATRATYQPAHKRPRAMRKKRSPRRRRSSHNWRTFWIMVLSLSLFFYFLAVGVSELFLLVLIAAWTNWCTRR